MDLSTVALIIALVLLVASVCLTLAVLAGERRTRRRLHRIDERLDVLTTRVSHLGDEAPTPETDEVPGQVAVVLNPSKFEDADELRRRIAQVIEAFDGTTVRFYETTVEDPGQGQTRQALQEGAELVLAAGGDGTVRHVAAALVDTDVAMGIIPAGTGNLLARNLDVPLDDVEGAVIAALNGTPERSDVGWLRWADSSGALRDAEPSIFLVMAGFGADAEIMGSTDSVLKSRIGWLAYVVAGAKKLVGSSHRIMASFPDGRRLAMKARTVILGNVGELPGGIVLMPDAKMDNGKLEVLIADWRGAAGFTQVLTGVLNSTKASKTFMSALQRHLTTGLTVSTSSPWPVQLDGDTEGEATHLHGEVQRKALLIRVPRGS